MLSPEESAERGLRDWPQQEKGPGSWQEQCKDGDSLVRYILDGSAVVTVTDSQSSISESLTPGSMIEVSDAAKVEWQAEEPVLILTPNYEEFGFFVVVLVTLAITSIAALTLTA